MDKQTDKTPVVQLIELFIELEQAEEEFRRADTLLHMASERKKQLRHAMEEAEIQRKVSDSLKSGHTAIFHKDNVFLVENVLLATSARFVRVSRVDKEEVS